MLNPFRTRTRHSLTEGRVAPGILLFTLPLIVSNVFQTLYNTVDSFFVGQYSGTQGLAAVSVCEPLMTVMIIVLGGLSSGVSIVIANYSGAGGEDGLSDACAAAGALYLALAVAVSALGLLFAPQILRLVQTPQEAFPQALSYLRVIFCGTVFMFGFNLIGALQRGLGDSVSSMRVGVAAAVINTLLDYVLVCRMGWGATGAAVATVLAQAASFFIGLALLRRQSRAAARGLAHIGLRRAQLLPILRIGAPTALNELFVTLAMLTVSAVANSQGLAASAAYGIGRKIDNLAVISDGAMNSAMSAFASQNVGAGKPERALKGLKCALVFSGLVGLAAIPFVYRFAPSLVRVFESDPAVVARTVSYLRVSIFSYVLFALVGPLIGFIRGTGNQMVSVVVGLVAQYGFRVPTALIAGHFLGLTGCALAVLAGPLSSVALYGVIVATGRWKRGLRNMAALGGSAARTAAGARGKP